MLGGADVVSMVIRSSLAQLRTPDAMRGRVSAVNSLFTGTSNQLGEFEPGLAAASLGAVPAVLIGGLGTILVAGLWMYLFPELRRLGPLRGVARGRRSRCIVPLSRESGLASPSRTVSATRTWSPSPREAHMDRRAFLTTAGISATALAFPAVLRAQSKDPVRIGCPLPLSGPFAALAKDMQQGAQLAEAELNAKGGILGRKVEVLFRDDQLKPRSGPSPPRS